MDWYYPRLLRTPAEASVSTKQMRRGCRGRSESYLQQSLKEQLAV